MKVATSFSSLLYLLTSPSLTTAFILPSLITPRGSLQATSENVVYGPDGSVRLDINGDALTIDRYLNTQPLRDNLLSRPGPGGRDLTYLAGDTIVSTLNEAFGYDGWSLQVLQTEQLHKQQGEGQAAGKWFAAYAAHVRITLSNGTYREDWGTGDATDRNPASAMSLALKASVTDAMKRTARQYGDKLGNCLYNVNFDARRAPRTLEEALQQQIE